MSTIVKTHLYEEDLHGNNPNNLITNELHTLQLPDIDDYYFIIPRAAPFFVFSVKVYNYQTGEELVLNTDYKIGHHFIEAQESIGRPIGGSIRFMRRDITGTFRLEYRTIGGQWGFDDAAILAELSRRQYNPLERVWGHIDPVPCSFPPLIHDQSLDTLVGSEDLDASLQRIGDILASTTAGIDESHIADRNNPHRTNKGHVGLGNVDNFNTATIEQTVQGDSEQLFVTPRGLYQAIYEQAVLPLRDYVADQTGALNITKHDIGLGNVENYPPATAEEAVDVSNNEVYLTPYTANLLLHHNTEDPRLNELINQFNLHINAINPHGITPAEIGAITEPEVLQLLETAVDAVKFAGLTPEEWKDLFPHDEDFMGLMEQLTEVESDVKTQIETGEVLKETSGTDAIKYLTATPNAYGYLTEATKGQFVNELNIVGIDGYTTAWTANVEGYCYYDRELQDYTSYGSVPNVPISLGIPQRMWSSPAGIIILLKNNKLVSIDASDTLVELLPEDNEYTDIEVYLSQDVDGLHGEMVGLLQYVDNGIVQITPFGVSNWVSKFNSSPIASIDFDSLSIALTESRIVTYNVGTNDLDIYQFDAYDDYGITKDNTDYKLMTDSKDVVSISDYLSTNSGFSVNGIYETIVLFNGYNFALMDFRRPNDPYICLQRNRAVNYTKILAGKDYILTLNNHDRVSYWADDPDNVLVCNSLGGSI